MSVNEIQRRIVVMKKVMIFLVIILVLVSLNINLPCSSSFLSLSFSETDTIDLPIVMYHSVLKTRQAKYAVSPTQLENDIIAYKKLGYTPVTLREVADWVDGSGVLPEKPMVITFDDGHYNNLHYALPILKKHNCKAVINVVTSFSKFSSDTLGEDNKPAYSYLTWDNLRELYESGLIEIGNHTHQMHQFKPRYGIAKVSTETIDEYCENLKTDIERANELITAASVPRPITFAYPFGKYTKEGRQVLDELGFRALLTCTEGTSQIKRGDPESIKTLKRYNRSGNTTTEAFVKKVFG